MELTEDDVLPYLDRALDQLATKVAQAGEHVSTVPYEGANSVFALVTHTLAVIDFWAAHVVCGDPTTRDRDAEFVATGTSTELLASIASAKALLPEGIGRAMSFETPTEQVYRDFMDGRAWTTASVLLHLLEEVYQHLGHVDITADIVTQSNL